VFAYFISVEFIKGPNIRVLLYSEVLLNLTCNFKKLFLSYEFEKKTLKACVIVNRLDMIFSIDS